MNDVKQTLWFLVHKRKIAGIRFYRHYPLGAFVLDCYSPTIKLMLEINPENPHDHASRKNDLKRICYLHSLGVRILSFDKLQILHETHVAEEVIQQVVTKMSQSLPVNDTL